MVEVGLSVHVEEVFRPVCEKIVLDHLIFSHVQWADRSGPMGPDFVPFPMAGWPGPPETDIVDQRGGNRDFQDSR